jgi:hypothetical protein
VDLLRCQLQLVAARGGGGRRRAAGDAAAAAGLLPGWRLLPGRGRWRRLLPRRIVGQGLRPLRVVSGRPQVGEEPLHLFLQLWRPRDRCGRHRRRCGGGRARRLLRRHRAGSGRRRRSWWRLRRTGSGRLRRRGRRQLHCKASKVAAVE